MELIRVGPFELHPSERLLRAGGKRVELGARAFDLLLVLVENAGRLVTKSALLDRVWPGLVVEENNLPTQIASLRRALGAQAIRTVPGFGYRLELEVSSNSPDETPAPAPPRRNPELPRLAVSRHPWPDRLGPLLGRNDDVRNVQQALMRSCLVTIVGIAGVGKTRLAQEILVHEAGKPATVAWVSLAPLDDVRQVPAAIALSLGLSLPEDVDGFVALSQALEDVSVLLILDCAERLAEGLAKPIAELVSRTQDARVLVTSQVPLGIAGEVVYRLSSLPVPEPGTPHEDAAAYAAVALFAERAAAADRQFKLSAGNTALVVEICRQLDGIPLALELAAARVPALGTATLLERLDDRFRLLRLAGQPSDPRHGTLHAAFEWSYNLLTPSEQRVLNRLGAFAGSFSLNAAAACVADETIDTTAAIDLLGRLVDRSLVTVLALDPPRYTLLETARHFALAQLAANAQLEAARGRMAATMRDLLDRAYQEYWSLDEALWLDHYKPELANVRAALDWAMGNDHALCIALFGSAWPLFVETDLCAEGRARYMQMLALLADDVPRARIGRFWEAIAAYDAERQFERAQYAAELAATHADASDTRSRYYALMQLALSARATAAARSAFEAARALEDPAWPARLLAHGAIVEGALLTSVGQFIEARVAYERAVRLAMMTSERLALSATVRIVELDVACGNTAAALQLARPLAISLRHLGRRETRFELLALSFAALLTARELDEARATGAELHEVALRLKTSKLYTVLDAMALLACEERRFEAAARIAACSHTAHELRGPVARTPAEERMRATVAAALEESIGPDWLACGNRRHEPLDDAGACSLALGLLP
jgi:predicted ATPase/DNA-binding winged helix-turn-helix (wHTH) protein